MSMRREAIHFVICDGCGDEHHDRDARSAIEARVRAGVAGWKFQQGKPGRHGKGAVAHLDACPDCTIEGILRSSQGSGA